ncbi:hypothetical protein F3Y22_tig00110946pilonHSYRG00104 [Hibiscus syriacus]|uniref:RING-type E3 ubiquitin transferase n=1 Tax=Hibiscus syriacus TaxID=106335 RepID=A0A6A2ZBK9_HIBSY|nr:RING finger protein 141-like [Hibiscus syriacus]KAE8688966.1 hypothetical protein F3Y22_tig00110946pilonHSYRG00104 [Hibiscus syriacus]
MQRDSGSWYADYGTWYCVDKWMGELTRDQIPQDYEEEVHISQFCGRFRYCHALLEHHNDLDTSKIYNIFYKNLFEESTTFTPWENEIPEDFKINRDSEIFNYIDSTYRAKCNKNIDKFLIIVKFGVFKMNYDTYHDYSSDDDGEIDEEIGFVPASKSSIEALEKVLDLGSEFECAICLDEGKIKAKRMPCGHAFHGRCIEKWLEKSHSCPLCRYNMPIDS